MTSNTESFQSNQHQNGQILFHPGFPETSSDAVLTVPNHTGRLISHAGFSSRYIITRNFSVWLPPGYSESNNERYPVIYAHDGQNLFDSASAFSGVDWGVDEALIWLAAEGVRPTIVVGIWNSADRWQEYNPQRIFENLMTPEEQAACVEEYGRPSSDLYLRFIVEELKPFIDSHYFTLPDRQNTFMMGSSMGGLISAYAICEYPEVFGAAACLSTHWPACQGKMVDYLREYLPDPVTHRFYFDYGTETLDALYEPYQLQVDDVLQKSGFTEEGVLLIKKFAGEEHSEKAWRRRVDIPLLFLLADQRIA